MSPEISPDLNIIGGDYSDSWINHAPKSSPVYQTNKMRFYLKALFRSEGMGPARHGYHTVFYDKMAIDIPNYYSIWIGGTDHYLAQYPYRLYKDVIIWKTEMTYSQEITYLQLENALDGFSKIPILGDLLPGLLGISLDVFKKNLKIEQVSSIKVFTVWEYLNYKHTLANDILIANWQEALSEIGPYLQKTYG